MTWYLATDGDKRKPTVENILQRQVDLFKTEGKNHFLDLTNL